MYFTCMSPCTHCGVSHCHLRILDEEMGGSERRRGMSRVKQLESGRAVSNWASKLGLLPPATWPLMFSMCSAGQRVQARKGIPQVLQGLPFSWGNLLALLLRSCQAKGWAWALGVQEHHAKASVGPAFGLTQTWSSRDMKTISSHLSFKGIVLRTYTKFSQVYVTDVGTLTGQFLEFCVRPAQVGAHGEQAC